MPDKKNTVPLIKARIDRLSEYEDSKIKAFASVNIGGAFAIHGIRVIDSQKGLFVQMPQSSYQKNGKTEYTQIAHPISVEAREKLNEAVLAAYEQEVGQSEDETDDFDEEPDHSLEQSM